MRNKVLISITLVMIILGAFLFPHTNGLVTLGSSKTNLDFITNYKSSLPDNNVVIEFGRCISCYLL